MSQFSSHESVSLEKNIQLNKDLTETKPEDIEYVYEVNKCAEWIRQNGFQRVCLQFPDNMLPDSTEVALKLQHILGQTVYVLGDTAYESCCIDYLAAAHIDADAIIHFGPTCFSKTCANVPYLNIYEKYPLNIDELITCCSQIFHDDKKDVIWVLDTGYFYLYDNILRSFHGGENLKVQRIDEELIDVKEKTILFIGNNQRKLMNIHLNYKPESLYYFDPDSKSPEVKVFQIDSKIIKRRYFLVEKIKDAKSVGIVVGTLGVKNYLKIIERVKKLVELRGKKYYLISVGKPSVAKLANFAEIDIYVMITCSMNEIYENRDFYKPVVTPYDIEIALNSNTNDLQFSYDYNRYLNNLEGLQSMKNNEAETDVSLLTGKLRSKLPQKEIDSNTETDSQVALKPEGIVAVNSDFGAGFLNERSWKGLEQNLGRDEVKIAEEGRKGIARGYENEQI